MKDHQPAIVREEQSLEQMMAECQAIDSDIAKGERANLEKAVRQGKLLIKIKAKCEHGQWLARLQKMGIPQQRASERILIAQLPPEELAKCSSIREAVEKAKELAAQGQGTNGVADPPKVPAPVLSNESESSPTIQLESVFCRECRVGSPKKNCKDCQAIRAKLAGKPAPSEPGEDHEESAAEEVAQDQAKDGPKNGEEVFSAREFNALWKKLYDDIGTIVRASHKVAKTKGELEAPEYTGWKSKLEEVLGDFKKWCKQMTGIKPPEIGGK